MYHIPLAYPIFHPPTRPSFPSPSLLPSQTILHGAGLGLGLSSLGSCDEEAFEDIKSVLYTDSAVAGEAAGLAMGLLLCGSLSDKAGEMLAYAHDTQHEKIIR